MKNKKGILTMAFVGAIILGGLSVSSETYAATTTQKTQQKIISVDEANKIALAQTINGEILKTELDTENGVLVYEIDVLENNIKKEFEIEATTGRILKIDNGRPRHHKNDKGPYHKNGEQLEVKVSMDEAKKIALAETKNGTIKSIEFEDRRGLPVYEVEVLEGNVKREFKVDATNGNILKFEDKYNSNYGKKYNNAEVKVSMDEAKNIALKNSNKGTVKSIELDSKRGLPVYEVEILEGNIEREFKIDATNGNIIKIKN